MDSFEHDRRKYGGKYVATSSFSNTDVVAYGKDPSYVYKRALTKGIKEPVISFVPEEGMICMY